MIHNGKHFAVSDESWVTVVPLHDQIEIVVGVRQPGSARAVHVTPARAREIASELTEQATWLEANPGATVEEKRPYVVDQESGKFRAPHAGETPHDHR